MALLSTHGQCFAHQHGAVKPSRPRRHARVLCALTVQHADAARTNPWEGLHAVVVGAGPAGSTAAMLLARRGMAVDVYEKRERPSDRLAASLHSYPMMLSQRSRRALEAAGAEPACCSEGSPTVQGIVSLASGKTFVRPRSSYLVHRVGLAADLVDVASEVPAISFHFGHSLREIDAASSTAVLDGPDGRAEAPYDLLVAADGANSTARGLLQAADPELRVAVRFRPEKSGYLTFHGVDAPPQIPAEHAPRQWLYMISDATKAGRASSTMWRDEQGRVSGMLVQPSNLEQAQQEALLASAFPQLPGAFRHEVAAQTCSGSQAVSAFGHICQCSKFHSGRAILLGDSAHAVTSTLGQGCNTALESCAVLDAVLDRTSTPEQAAAAFTTARLPDAHALQDLEFMQACAANTRRRYGSAPLRAYVRALNALSTVAGLVLVRLGLASTPLYLYEALSDARLSQRAVRRNWQLVGALGLGLAVCVLALLVQGARAAWR